MIKAVIICFIYAALNVTGTTLIKHKLRGRILSDFNDWIQFLFNIQVLIAFIIIFGSALILFKALSSGAFTFIVPVAVGINFILTVVAGYYVFKDSLSIISFLGFSLIISGIVLLSINNNQHAIQ